jgi:hypothetical protein
VSLTVSVPVPVYQLQEQGQKKTTISAVFSSKDFVFPAASYSAHRDTSSTSVSIPGKAGLSLLPSLPVLHPQPLFRCRQQLYKSSAATAAAPASAPADNDDNDNDDNDEEKVRTSGYLSLSLSSS